MASILYLDLAGGISGDMLLAALVDAGVPWDLIEGELALLPVRGYTVETFTETRSSIRGRRVDVKAAEQSGHGHRSWAEIKSLISGSAVGDRAKSLSLRVFERLARAEAAVHGIPAEEIEFHEVGAVDSIVDIVGCAVALSYLDPAAVLCGAIELGTGKTVCMHGEIPLPAPATLNLLSGIPVKIVSDRGETVTPTGAAFLAELAAFAKETPMMNIRMTGAGFGSRNGPGTGALRAIVGEVAAPAISGDSVVIEANIDDMNPQVLPRVIELLLEAGAKDAWVAPVTMKKGRPAFLLSAITDPDLVGHAAHIILSESTTIGLRYHAVERIMLERRIVPVETPYGTIGMKVATAGDETFTASPEYDDCAAAAGRCGVPVKEVIASANIAFRGMKDA